MGTGTLKNVNNADPIAADDVNQLVNSMKGDLHVRGADGQVADSVANIGSPAFQVKDIYISGNIFQNGQEFSGGGGGGGGGGTTPGTVTPSRALSLGVVSGKSAAGYAGSPGYLNPAGSAGITIRASEASPLILKVRGVNYEITEDVTGGGVLSDYTKTCTFQITANSQFPGIFDNIQRYTRDRYKALTGAPFIYSSPAEGIIPTSQGNIFAFKTAVGSYIIAQRDDDSKRTAKLGQSQVINTSTTGYSHEWTNIPSNNQVTAVRVGVVMLDPSTSTPTIVISPRMVSTNIDVLPTTGYNAGDTFFRESDQSIYRFNGNVWQISNLCPIGIAVFENGSCVGTAAVRTEEAMDTLLARKLGTLGDKMMREAIADDAGERVFFGGDTSGDIEEKGTAELLVQTHNKISSDAVFSIADDGTKENGKLVCGYLDAEGDTANYFYEEVPPVITLYKGRGLLIHPYRSAIYVGSWAWSSTGAIHTKFRIGSDYNLHRLSENNDDTWLVNASMFPRCRVIQAGNNRRMEIKLRSTAGTSTLRQTTGRFFNYNLHRASDWDRHFYDRIVPYVMEQMWYDCDASPGSATDWQFQITDWTEADFLHAVGLSRSSREGRLIDEANVAGATGAGGQLNQTSGGSLINRSIDGQKIDFGTVKYENMDPEDIAGETDISSPDPDNPKLVTDVALDEKITELENEVLGNWGDWSADTDKALAATLVDGANLTLFGTESMDIKNSSSFDAKTSTIPNGKLVYAGPNCANMPALADAPPEGTAVLRGALLFIDGSGRRWAVINSNPETEDTDDVFYLDSTSNNWISQLYDADTLKNSFSALPDDNRWYPISATAHDEPSGNEWQVNMNIGRRNNTSVSGVLINYSTNTNQHLFTSATRSRGGDSFRNDIIFDRTTGPMANRGLQPSGDTVSLITGRSFSDYRFITLITHISNVDIEADGGYVQTAISVAAGITAVGGSVSSANPPYFTLRNTSNSNGFYNFSVQSDTSFQYTTSSGLNDRLYRIIGTT